MPCSHQELEDFLMKELRLYHYPVAVTYYSSDEDLQRAKEIIPHYVPARPLTFCQWEIAARMEGKTIIGNKKYIGCHSCKITFGWEDIKDDDIKSLTDVNVSYETARNILYSKPRLSLGSIKGVSVGPLGKAILDPHVIHFYCDNIQSFFLAKAYMRAIGVHPLRPIVCDSSAACGGGVYSYQKQTFNITPCCKGSYSSGKTERGEVNVFIPGAHLQDLMKCLRDILRNDDKGSFPGADICTNCSFVSFKEA